MQITLLGQGYEATSTNSVGNQLIKFFSQKDFHTFTGISAFASQAGVNGLAKHIAAARKHLKIISIITGVDQKGTSKEALEALLNLKIYSNFIEAIQSLGLSTIFLATLAMLICILILCRLQIEMHFAMLS